MSVRGGALWGRMVSLGGCSRCWRGAREVAGGARGGEWGAHSAPDAGHSFGDEIACVRCVRRKLKV